MHPLPRASRLVNNEGSPCNARRYRQLHRGGFNDRAVHVTTEITWIDPLVLEPVIDALQQVGRNAPQLQFCDDLLGQYSKDEGTVNCATGSTATTTTTTTTTTTITTMYTTHKIRNHTCTTQASQAERSCAFHAPCMRIGPCLILEMNLTFLLTCSMPIGLSTPASML